MTLLVQHINITLSGNTHYKCSQLENELMTILTKHFYQVVLLSGQVDTRVMLYTKALPFETYNQLLIMQALGMIYDH